MAADGSHPLQVEHSTADSTPDVIAGTPPSRRDRGEEAHRPSSPLSKMGECPGGARGPRDRAETPLAAANDNDRSPAAPAAPVPLAAQFGWVRAFAEAQRTNVIAPGRLSLGALAPERRP